MKLAARCGRVVTGRVSRHVDQLAVDEFPIADKRGGQPPEAFNSMVTRTLYFAVCNSSACIRL